MTSAPITFPKSFDPPATGTTAASPLSAAHVAELLRAQLRAKKIRRAINVATTDAWLCAIFAGLTLVSGVFSPVAILLGLALAACAHTSFRGVRQLKNFNPAAPRLLALNQLAVAMAIITYAAWSLYVASRGDTELSAAAASAGPEVAQALNGLHIDQFVWLVSLALYGSLIAGTIVAQGLTALYYASRKKHLAAYLAETPAWILQLQKTQHGG